MLDDTMIMFCLCIPACTCVYTIAYACAFALQATLLLELIGNFFAYALSVKNSAMLWNLRSVTRRANT